MSISFERAAGYYDRTRAIPDAVMAELIPMLTEQIGVQERCLEIGVGTGRLALPLAGRGVHIVGIDISPAMLRRLVENSHGAALPVAVADATRLPFADGTFGCAIAAHVLHLIPTWRQAIDELLRVVRPGGRLLATRGHRTAGGWTDDVRRQFFIGAGDPAWPPGIDRIEQLDEHMAGLGAVARMLPTLAEQATASINELLANLEAGYWSACWGLDDRTRRESAAQAREWAVQNIGDLDEQRPVTEAVVFRAYDLA